MEGGPFSLSVEAPASCAWQATVTGDFLTLTSGTTGKGNATVQVMAASNSGEERTGSVLIGETRIYVSQAGPGGPGPRVPEGCTYTVNPPSASASAGAGTIGIQVQTQADCPWAASSSDSFISIISGIVGSGPGTVVVALAANSGSGRTGSVVVAGRTVLIAQAAAGGPTPPPPTPSTCTFTVNPTSVSIPGTGGTATVDVTAPPGCNWTATASGAGIYFTISSGASGSGNGTVTLTAPANTGLGARSRPMTIAGRSVQVTQDVVCPWTITPGSPTTVPAEGGTITFILTTTNPSCTWTANVPEFNAAFMTITSPASGTGSGSVTAVIAAHTGTTERTFSFQVADKFIVIRQPPRCLWTVSPTLTNIGAEGGSITINFTTTAPGCSWTAVTTSPHVAFTSPTSGVGSGSVTVQIAANTDVSRSLTVNVANQSVHIDQAAGANCANSFNLNQLALFDLNGGTRTAFLSASFSCNTTVSGGDSFVTVVNGASGTGARDVTYSVAPNNTGAARQTTLVAGGRSFVIRQSAAPPANASFFAYNSAGEYVGAGQAHLYLLGEATWSATVSNGTLVTIGISGPSLSWTVRFAAPDGQPLVPGTYEGARRWPNQPAGSPGLDFGGNGRGCNTLTGRFVVLEAVYGPGGTITRFHATFEQHCEGAAPALTGEVRVLADPWR